MKGSMEDGYYLKNKLRNGDFAWKKIRVYAILSLRRGLYCAGHIMQHP